MVGRNFRTKIEKAGKKYDGREGGILSDHKLLSDQLHQLMSAHLKQQNPPWHWVSHWVPEDLWSGE